MSASQTGAITVGATEYFSASKLDLTWTAPTNVSVEHYEVTATEALQSTFVTTEAAASATSATIEDLKSSTEYTVTLTACLDVECANSLTSDASVTATTATEVWELQGSGTHTDGSYTTADLVVRDGETLSDMIVYPATLTSAEDPDGTLAGTAKFYYGAAPSGDWQGGMHISEGTASSETGGFPTFQSNLDEDATDGSYNPHGIKQPCDPASATNSLSPWYRSCADGDIRINATQALPLANTTQVQLIFEAETVIVTESPSYAVSVSESRLYALTSDQDLGYAGESFALDSSAVGSDYVCNADLANDLGSGGACEATVIVGLEDDADEDGGGSGLSDLRQSKVGYPKLDSWKWDQSAGTFMALSATSATAINDGTVSCDEVEGIFYATYDATGAWNIERDENGCAKALASKAHGPFLVHLGGVRYKMYYEDYTTGSTAPGYYVDYCSGFATTSATSSSNANCDGTGITNSTDASGSRDGNASKPLHLIYADGALTGDPNVVDFDDWEEQSQAHEVDFIWHDGAAMTVYDESGLSDHNIITINESLEYQYMTANLGGNDDATPTTHGIGLGYAKLINP